MITVFSGTLPSLSDPGALYGRAGECAQLEKLLSPPRNCVVVGPKGAGKASLLASYLSPEYRARAVLEQRRLYHFTPDFPEEPPAGDTLAWFCSQLLAAVEDLHRLALQRQRRGEEGAQQAAALEECYALLRGLIQSHTPSERSEERFQQLLEDFAGADLRLTLVIQHFQTFTRSRCVTEGQLRSISQLGRMTFLVATDYAFDKLASTELTGGSSFVHTFTGNELPLGGWSEADTRGYLESAVGGAAGQAFAARWGRLIYQGSGGIPVLVRYLADGFARLSERAPEPDPAAEAEAQKADYQQAVQAALPLASHYFRDWCRQLTYTQAETLALCANTKKISALVQLREEKRDTLRELRERGLIREISCDVATANGGTAAVEVPTISCGLFRNYIQQNDLLQENTRQVAADSTTLRDRLVSDPAPERTREDLRTLMETGTPTGSTLHQEYRELWEAFDQDTDHIPEPLLRLHETPRSTFGVYSKHVRQLLFQALLTEKCLMPILDAASENSTMTAEASPCGVLYFKAAEAALDEVLAPLLEKWCPEQYAAAKAKKNTEVMTLGQYCYYLHGPGIKNNVLAGKCPGFDRDYWNHLDNLLSILTSTRNDGPHAGKQDEIRSVLFPDETGGFFKGSLDSFTANFFGPNGLLTECATLAEWVRRHPTA